MINRCTTFWADAGKDAVKDSAGTKEKKEKKKKDKTGEEAPENVFGIKAGVSGEEEDEPESKITGNLNGSITREMICIGCEMIVMTTKCYDLGLVCFGNLNPLGSTSFTQWVQLGTISSACLNHFESIAS